MVKVINIRTLPLESSSTLNIDKIVTEVYGLTMAIVDVLGNCGARATKTKKFQGERQRVRPYLEGCPYLEG